MAVCSVPVRWGQGLMFLLGSIVDVVEGLVVEEVEDSSLVGCNVRAGACQLSSRARSASC